MSDEENLDDKTVVFDSPTERIVHVHRVNIVANIRGEWTRPTLLIAAEGQTPVFCHRVLVRGPSQIVERPPGVHIVLHDTTRVIALDAAGTPLPLPDWAHPRRSPDELEDVEVVGRVLGDAMLHPEALGVARNALARIRRALAHVDCAGS